MDIYGSFSTRDSETLGRIGMSLFEQLKIPLVDIRGMGITVSKLDHDQAQEIETAPGQITNWLKRSIQQEAYPKNQDVGDNFPIKMTGKSTNELDEEIESVSEEKEIEPVADMDTCDSPRNLFPVEEEEIDTYPNSPGVHWKSQVDETELHKTAGLPSLFQEEIMYDSDGEFNSQLTPAARETYMVASQLDSDSVESPPTEEQNSNDIATPFSQIALPPLSQIHMSQVKALPSALRDAIMSKIEHAERMDAAFREKPREIVCLDGEEDHSSTVTEQATRQLFNDSAVELKPENSAVSRAGNKTASRLSLEPASARFRQTSLKRMMRLAAVKCGEETTGISLTQLEHLPLELKLQLANDDADLVGALSQRKPRARKEVAQTTSSHHGREMSSVASIQERPRQCDHVADDHDAEVEETETDTYRSYDPIDFYHQNVKPLKVFLDENQSTDAEALGNTFKFLVTVLSEGRVRDVMVLLRSVRNRRDEWSEEPVLEEMANALDEENLRQYGYRLDIDWLLGRSS
jgi:hypothetical protein